MIPARHWQDMPSSAFGQLAANTVAILPVGAIEQHGPHLPVFVDSCINAGLLDIALKTAPADLPITALPMQSVGKSDEHISFPGTLTVSAEVLTGLLMEIGRSVFRAGIRRLILLNSHGGQPQVMDIVARGLRVELGMFVVNAAWSKMGMPKGLFSPEECEHGIHGGEIETSLMLHLRPDLVDMGKAENFVSLSQTMQERFRILTPEGKVGFGWQVEDLNPKGACGNAAAADAERGRLVAEHAASRFLDLCAEVADYPAETIGVPARAASVQQG
ncbi:MAG TPA: creatininase family protein [Novosphingobium sp.]|nr:creatininase family protein [Novosphingobium sp.]HZV11073.1 creatininase family protein [Novosphingobium sp.]